MKMNLCLTVVTAIWLSFPAFQPALADNAMALYERMRQKAYGSDIAEGMLNDCNRLIAIDPECKRFKYMYTIRAMAYRDDAENEKALKDLEVTKKLGQVDSHYHLTRAYCLQSMGRMAEAIPEYDAMLKEKPNSPWIYHSRAASLESANKFDAALADLTKAVALEPTNTKFISNHARLLERLHRYDAAIADYGRLLKLNENDETTYFLRGKVYMAQGKNKEALADFTKAIDNDEVPTKSVYLCRAAVYDKLGKPDMAKNDRKTAATMR